MALELTLKEQNLSEEPTYNIMNRVTLTVDYYINCCSYKITQFLFIALRKLAKGINLAFIWYVDIQSR